MKKNFITGVIIGGLLFGTAGVLAGQYTATENPFPVQLNGNDVSIEGYNIEGSTYFKLRDIADIIGGFDVGFNNNTIQLAKDGYSYSSDNGGDVDIHNYISAPLDTDEEVKDIYYPSLDYYKKGNFYLHNNLSYNKAHQILTNKYLIFLLLAVLNMPLCIS